MEAEKEPKPPASPNYHHTAENSLSSRPPTRKLTYTHEVVSVPAFLLRRVGDLFLHPLSDLVGAVYI